MFFEQMQLSVLGQYLSVFLPQSRIFGLYLLSAFVLAFFVYEFGPHDDAHDGEGKKSFLAYVFDRDVYRHASTWQDVKYFLLNAILYYGVASQFLIGTHGFAALFGSVLTNTFGVLEAPVITNEWGLLIYTVLAVITLDIGVYLTHRAQHEIPVLWEFHKVHHSAEKLNPMTLYRMHPVDLIVTALVVSLLSGLAFAGMFYLSGETPQQMTLLGLNIIIAAFYLLGYNLRHSHIWLNYPGWLSRIFISPAQHQIHHSSDPKHFDKNFGLIFSVWDWVGKTLYIPRRKENLIFGLSRAEPNPFKTMGDIYLKPFVWAGAILRDKITLPRRRVLAGMVGVVFVMGYAQTLQQADRQISLASLPSVHMEQLTWTEVSGALAEGYDTVLIPTAGIEQNGPHVVLGKHNIVIRQTTHDVAHALGKTLVAPVLDFVPEGAVEPVLDGHMMFAGTISVPDEVFEDILRETAKSLKAHGFRNIFFVGDSGGNQDGQARVAAALNEAWRNEGMIVAHLDQYYSGNGQFSYLQQQGFSEAEIGYHAGIRDTSEVMFIAPEHVRAPPVTRYLPGPSGVSGNRFLASAGIGQKMIALKVEAALTQIDAILDAAARNEDADNLAAYAGEDADKL